MSQPKVTVVDYGTGNLLGVCRALEYCGADIILTSDAAQIKSAERLVLPGVGAFADGMAGLKHLGLITAIKDYVCQGKPLLGICLGMQMLMDRSEEYGEHEGLGLMAGNVIALPKISPEGRARKIPHMGWSDISPSEEGLDEHGIIHGMKPGTVVYFAHSYYVQPKQKSYCVASGDYDGMSIPAVIAHNKIFGCQFHPEKSAMAGLELLRNFIRI